MSSVKLLIVDDEEKLANTLKSYFETSGYQVWVANTGEEALLLLEQHRPDVLLVDWKLEGSQVQGLDVLQKAKELLPGVIVLMLSGFGETERAEALQRGADAFLEKPLLLPEVRKAVQDALAKRPHTNR